MTTEERAVAQSVLDRPDRRGGTRQSLVLRVAKLRCCGGEYLCIVQDVSETGVKLRLFHAHPPDSHMFLELSNGALFAIERRWIDGDHAGFRFSSPIDLEAFMKEPGSLARRPMRVRFQRPAVLKAASGDAHAMLINLSQQGACIEAGRRLALKERVRIEVDGVPARIAHVCWRREYTHGLVFQESFALRELAGIAFECQPYQAEPMKVARWAEQARALCA